MRSKVFFEEGRGGERWDRERQEGQRVHQGLGEEVQVLRGSFGGLCQTGTGLAREGRAVRYFN